MNPNPTFGGRTSAAQLPTFLLEHLQKTFTAEKFQKQFPKSKKVILFGEGYGAKIQAPGSRYRKDVSFTLFDVWTSGWWLQKETVIEIGQEMGIDHLNKTQVMTRDEAVEYVKSKPTSFISEDKTLVMEGIIARSDPMMLFRNSKTPIMFKLKVRDFYRD